MKKSTGDGNTATDEALERAVVLAVRRTRGWAPTTDVRTLGRSARHLAHASTKQIDRPEVAACFEKYRYAAAVERTAKLIRGDLLVELIDGYGIRAIDIARRTGERPADLSQMYRTAKAFPRESRPSGVAYNILMIAAWMARRFPELNMSPSSSLDEIRRNGLSQHRDVTRHFAGLARRCSIRARILPVVAEDGDDLVNRPHLSRFQELLPRFKDRSISILSIDPPYVYGGTSTYRSRSARSTDCDADHPAAAVGLVIDVLRDWQRKLADGGVMLLWQPWQAPLPAIVSAAHEHAWSVVGPVIWDKGRPQPGRFDSPYMPQGEMLWILHRPGDRLVNHDSGSREMILRFPPVSFPGRSHAQEHGFEKPAALCEHLIRKHSRPGDLVFDACGCTGAMSVAAIHCGRRWVYVESHPSNYHIGASRIARCLQDSARSSDRHNALH